MLQIVHYTHILFSISVILDEHLFLWPGVGIINLYDTKRIKKILTNTSGNTIPQRTSSFDDLLIASVFVYNKLYKSANYLFSSLFRQFIFLSSSLKRCALLLMQVIYYSMFRSLYQNFSMGP